jgi:hypothetical protein
MKLSRLMNRLSWVCFGLMWIPFAILMITIVQIPGGSYSWAELPPMARNALIGIGILGGLEAVLFPGSSIVRWSENRAVISRGELAQATILQVRGTGETINDDPVIRILLEVRPLYNQPFQAEAERTIPQIQIPQFQPGAVVQVKYDPQSKAVAIVDA